MHRLAELRRLLLGMLGQHCDGHAIAALSPADWNITQNLVAEHRLGPILHHCAANGPLGEYVPAEIADSWRAQHRTAGIEALLYRGEALRTAALLAQAGIPALFMKGAWLAQYAYPAAALRPMRDLDILVPAEAALTTWALLRKAGYAAPEGEAQATTFATIKQLPGLISPRGVFIELHLRPWEAAGDGAIGLPHLPEPDFFAHAGAQAPDDPLHYPAPADTLRQLVIHAVYSHGLDVGPLLLADIEYCLAAHAPDWPRFWAEAEQQGWSRAAALVFALTDRWRLPGLMDGIGAPGSPPADLLDRAPDLLLQELSAGRSKHIIAQLQGQPAARLPAQLWRLVRGGREAEGRYWQWLGNRLGEAARELTKRETWRYGRETAQLAAWLAGGD